MHIGIDSRYLSHGLVGGIHTYLAHFVPALIEHAHDHQIVLYADTKRPFELRDLPPHVRVRYLPYRNPLSSLTNDLLMRRVVEHDQIEVMHFPANYGFAPRGTRTVITLHDAINILPLHEIVRGHRKDPHTLALISYLHFCSTAALHRADLVLTVSEYARRELARVGRYDIERIVAIPHAPTPDLRRVTEPASLDAVRARYGIDKPFVLADGLKNPAVLLRAWHQLPAALRTSHRLVFFARREPLAVVRQAEAAGLAHLLINPPRSDLIALYSMAAAFVFPSWIEGFGIPLLEAMTCGAPVIASDRGAIPEVVGDAALLADAEDATGFAHHLTLVLGEPTAAQKLRERGMARAAQFSWGGAAQRVLQAYHEAITTAHAVGHAVSEPSASEF